MIRQRGDSVVLLTPLPGLRCVLRANGYPGRWEFTMSLVHADKEILLVAIHDLDGALPVVANRRSGQPMLLVGSAALELRSRADAEAAREFIAEHAASGGTK